MGRFTARQKKVEDLATISFPEGGGKLSDLQLQALRNTSKSPGLISSLDIQSIQHFKIDSFFLALHAEPLTKSTYSLEAKMKSIEMANTKNGVGRLVGGLKKINNYTVFIANVESKDRGLYSFYTVSANKTDSINGILHYDSTNKNSGNKVKALNKIVGNSKFN